jgi:hypothetical protein
MREWATCRYMSTLVRRVASARRPANRSTIPPWRSVLSAEDACGSCTPRWESSSRGPGSTPPSRRRGLRTATGEAVLLKAIKGTDRRAKNRLRQAREARGRPGLAPQGRTPRALRNHARALRNHARALRNHARRAPVQARRAHQVRAPVQALGAMVAAQPAPRARRGPAPSFLSRSPRDLVPTSAALRCFRVGEPRIPWRSSQKIRWGGSSLGLRR